MTTSVNIIGKNQRHSIYQHCAVIGLRFGIAMSWWATTASTTRMWTDG
jgi:hypothetical protein